MEIFSGLLRSGSTQATSAITLTQRSWESPTSYLQMMLWFFFMAIAPLFMINETVDDFAGWSGLQMNRDKTELFYAGVSQEETTALSANGFTIGSLSIRYLGLPLMHIKLKISEYSPLIDKLNSRFNLWATKSLSFAGRCLLIKTVITGTVNFWTSTFLLPRGCIKKIESLCSRFLLSGATDRRANVKVSWSTMCLPKDEGGIGLKNFKLWNITLLLHLAWLLFSGSSSLWVAWHCHHNCPTSYSFWSQSESPLMSWNGDAYFSLET